MHVGGVHLSLSLSLSLTTRSAPSQLSAETDWSAWRLKHIPRSQGPGSGPPGWVGAGIDTKQTRLNTTNPTQPVHWVWVSPCFRSRLSRPRGLRPTRFDDPAARIPSEHALTHSSCSLTGSPSHPLSHITPAQKITMTSLPLSLSSLLAPSRWPSSKHSFHSGPNLVALPHSRRCLHVCESSGFT
ncbi:hypothetical protein LY78DRAFT_287386 [Colletotrichum sublineola]|nr:hypothetical protein LY78DRAFT_287386 [Colletotrichum sublineola]